MSFRNFLHRSRWAKDYLEFCPPGHHFRNLKLETFLVPTPPFGDSFDWASCSKPLFILLLVWFVSEVVVGILWTSFLVLNLGMLLVIAFLFGLYYIARGQLSAIREFYGELQEHLELDYNDQRIISFSPSQFEDLCRKRLKSLAIELEEVEEHTRSFDKERLDARQSFDQAFRFFRDQGFVTGNRRQFFSHSEIKK